MAVLSLPAAFFSIYLSMCVRVCAWVGILHANIHWLHAGSLYQWLRLDNSDWFYLNYYYIFCLLEPNSYLFLS